MKPFIALFRWTGCRWIGFARRSLVIVMASFACAVSAMADNPVLDLSKPVSISCDTSAVILDASPFEASQGSIAIDLRLDDPADGLGPGRWKVAAPPSDHEASFIGGTQASCALDCPLTQGKDGTLQLWSPKPLALSQLDADTALVLVTINKKTLELKASMFRKKEMAGLERGECRLADSGLKSPEPEAGTSLPAEADPSTNPPPTESPEEAAESAAPPTATEKTE